MVRALPVLTLMGMFFLPTACVWYSDLTEEEAAAEVIVDDTPPPAPFTPTTEFDFPGSQAAVASGHAALAEGRYDSAVAYYESAIAAWPANPEAWNGLSAAYREVGQGNDLNYAVFFARRIDWADETPAAAVAASFRNIAAGQINRPVEDPRIRTMSEQLALYYAGLDVAERMAALGSRAEPETLLDLVGIVPAMVGTAALSIYVGAQMIGVFL